MPTLLRLLLPCCLLALCHPAVADEPLHQRNPSALARGTPLPVLGRSDVLSAGQQLRALSTDWSNDYYLQSRDGLVIELDGESWRLTPSARVGLGHGWELGASWPLIAQGGGVLDRSIEDWHRSFNLPDGGRPPVARNRLRYRLGDGERQWLDGSPSGWSAADLELLAGFRLQEGAALRGMLQLPTGDAERLSGGSLGLALWLDQQLLDAAACNCGATLSAGLSWAEADGPLAALARSWVGYGGLQLWSPAWQRLRLRARLDAHSALYDSPGPILEPFRDAVIGMLGLSWSSPGPRVDLAFQEDLVVGASPDFSLHLNLIWQPFRH